MSAQPTGLPSDNDRFDRLAAAGSERPAAAAGRPQAVDAVSAKDGKPLGAAAAEPGAKASPAAHAASFDVRYGLDKVANVWVAQFFDPATGEYVKSVPNTEVSHQLAELRALREHNRPVDKRA